MKLRQIRQRCVQLTMSAAVGSHSLPERRSHAAGNANTSYTDLHGAAGAVRMVEGGVYPVDGHFVGVSPRVTSAFQAEAGPDHIVTTRRAVLPSIRSATANGTIYAASATGYGIDRTRLTTVPPTRRTSWLLA
jgi:hypothetical protein